MENLWEACEKGSLEDVKKFIENGTDVDEPYEDGKTALLIAVEAGKLDLVKYLVKNKANVNAYVRVHRRLLKTEKSMLFHMNLRVFHYAIKAGAIDIVKFLVENGVYFNDVKSEAETDYLHFAVVQDSLEIVKYFIENGADVNYESCQVGTALHVAVEHGSLEIVKCLIDHGADVNYENKKKGTALHVAVKRGSLEIVEHLVEHGADVNYEGEFQQTALFVAVQRDSVEIVSCLVEHGADVNCRSENNETPLHAAVDSGCFKVVKYLIEHGADGTNDDKHLQYSLICLACKKGDQFFVNNLLASETVKSIDKRSGYRKSPLSIACSKGHPQVVRTLLAHNVDMRKERKLECRNDEIVNILEAELKKSVRHRNKIEILKSMDDKELTKVKPPLKHFAAKPSLSLGASSATFVYVGIMEDESEVAVKRMFSLSCSEAAENERKILELIDTKKSPFVVNYRHFFRDDTFIYLVLDLCEETLRELVHSQSIEYLQQHGPRMIKQILTGLEFLHKLGILHRDLKPSNVLVDPDGRMRLSDFGISRVLIEDETTDYTDPIGTTGWMAAEVIEAIKQKARKEKVACRYKKKSDVQVVGMIAYFILTKGKHLYGDPLDRMWNIVKGKAVNLKKLDDRNARKFVSWLISHKLEDRPYAHEALKHFFLNEIEEALQRPEIIRIQTTCNMS